MERISSFFLMGYAQRSGISFLQITHSFIANEIMNNFNLYFFTVAQPCTLPVTIRCVTENNKVDRRVADQFCLPIGATCNMDGAALYFAVVVIFLANLGNMSLTFGEVILTA